MSLKCQQRSSSLDRIKATLLRMTDQHPRWNLDPTFAIQPRPSPRTTSRREISGARQRRIELGESLAQTSCYGPALFTRPRVRVAGSSRFADFGHGLIAGLLPFLRSGPKIDSPQKFIRDTSNSRAATVKGSQVSKLSQGRSYALPEAPGGGPA